MIRASIRAVLAALLAIAQMLAPFVHLPARAATPSGADVCTSDGLRRLPVGDSPATPLHDDDHCMLCRVASQMAGAAPCIPAVARLQVAGGKLAPALASFVSRPPPHDAPARAPPAIH